MKPWWQPHIGDLEEKFVLDVLRSHYINEGHICTEFEQKLSKILNVPYVVATTSGTASLFLSLAALGVGPGDEVIVPDFTFIATANAARLTGAKVVLVDVDPETLTMDPEAFKAAITKNTKAVMPVHVSGRAAQMKEILSIAKEKNIFVVEDAAEALLSKYQGASLGNLGDLGILSFSANKMITMGQGGAVLTSDRKLYEKVRMLKDHGRPVRGTGGNDIHFITGYNFKLTNLQAAVGLAQLEYLPGRAKRASEIQKFYQEEFKSLEGLKILPFEKEDQPLWTDALSDQRDDICLALEKTGYECRKFWYPLHTQAPYQTNESLLQTATHLGPKAFWLPSHFLLTDSDLEKISESVKTFFKHRDRKGKVE